jgi:methionyl-tRNA synthetase
MPYGNKNLHFGHVGGVFVHADIFSRFLRDRIGKENVIFVSGTDCYGSPIVAHYQELTSRNAFSGTIEEFVLSNHESQKDVLSKYLIGLDLFAASAFGRASELHREFSGRFLTRLHQHGHLRKITNSQFFDAERQVFLNGRQVVGRCPIDGCQSEKGYADECSLGHQYMPKDLIDPKSALSGKTPEMRDVTNWYIDLASFLPLLKEWLAEAEKIPGSRDHMIRAIGEFLEPPVIYVKRESAEKMTEIMPSLPPCERTDDKSKAIILTFRTLEEREAACLILNANGVRFRTGKTLVPFRLTGNVEWSLPAPELEGLANSTFWVWPESLWAPIAFTAACLESQGKDQNTWKDWWCSKDAHVYQFIGEDNVYFYGPVEMAMLMGDQGNTPTSVPPEGNFQLPELIANKHILFLDKKASSSGAVKPPMAADLLQYYTPEQLRAHFFSLGLGKASVSFRPKVLDPSADPNIGDPVLKEGNLLCNVFNRAVRSCLYTVWKYHEGIIPAGTPSAEVLDRCEKAVLDFEQRMHRHEFHLAMAAADNLIRSINKDWVRGMDPAEKNGDAVLRDRTLVDCFHLVKVCTVLMHPVAPEGTEMIRDYFGIGEELWDWNRIMEPLATYWPDPRTHKLKFLEPRVDFFIKPANQIQ